MHETPASYRPCSRTLLRWQARCLHAECANPSTPQHGLSCRLSCRQTKPMRTSPCACAAASAFLCLSCRHIPLSARHQVLHSLDAPMHPHDRSPARADQAATLHQAPHPPARHPKSADNEAEAAAGRPAPGSTAAPQAAAGAAAGGGATLAEKAAGTRLAGWPRVTFCDAVLRRQVYQGDQICDAVLRQGSTQGCFGTTVGPHRVLASRLASKFCQPNTPGQYCRPHLSSLNSMSLAPARGDTAALLSCLPCRLSALVSASTLMTRPAAAVTATAVTAAAAAMETATRTTRRVQLGPASTQHQHLQRRRQLQGVLERPPVGPTEPRPGSSRIGCCR